jgi:hypothetical protein
LSNNPAPAHLTPRRITPIDRNSWAIAELVTRRNYTVRLASLRDFRPVTILRSLLVDCILPSLFWSIVAYYTIGHVVLSFSLETVLPYRLSLGYWAMAPVSWYGTGDESAIDEFVMRLLRTTWSLFFGFVLPSLLLTALCHYTIGGFMFYGSLEHARWSWRGW